MGQEVADDAKDLSTEQNNPCTLTQKEHVHLAHTHSEALCDSAGLKERRMDSLIRYTNVDETPLMNTFLLPAGFIWRRLDSGLATHPRSFFASSLTQELAKASWMSRQDHLLMN